MTMDNDKALVKPSDNDPVKTLNRFLGARSRNLGMFAASRIKPDTLIRLALFEFANNEWLRRCSPESIYGSLILAAQIGLEPSGIKGEAYLVPFKGKCTLIPGWRGLVKLALRSKAVKAMDSYVVYERDLFRVWLGSDPRIEHEPCMTGDRGDIIAAYAVARMDNGVTQIEVMTIEELDKIRKMAASSRGGKEGPAYQDWEDQMYRKAPMRRLAKRLPLGDDFFLAAKADELSEAGEPEKINTFIDVDVNESGAQQETRTDTVADQVAERAAKIRG